jgi:hypothetical protein
VSDEAIASDIAPLLGRMRLAEAARTVAEALDVPKARVYGIGLMLKGSVDRGER